MSNELGRRAIACKHWRWMPGMDTACGIVVHRDSLGLGIADWVGSGKLEASDIGPDELPDLTDPATLGCMLALVREAHGDPGMGIAYDGITWAVTDSNLTDRFSGDTEAEALVVALEAAP